MTLKDKLVYGVPAAFVTTLAISAPAFAEGTANSDVVTAFTGAADEVKATVIAIAGVAVGILIIMYAFKWGKKIFNRVAN